MTRLPDLALETERLLITVPPASAARQVLDYYTSNRTFHAPWDPPRPAPFYTLPFWTERLSMSRLEREAGKSLRLFFFLKGQPDGPVVGGANFTSIARGPFQCCRLGYALSEAYQGQGYMSEALRAALRYVFDELGLHRVEANYVPTNERSGAVLRRLGFTVNGYARDYLFINGAWRDHVLTSLTSPSPNNPFEG